MTDRKLTWFTFGVVAFQLALSGLNVAFALEAKPTAWVNWTVAVIIAGMAAYTTFGYIGHRRRMREISKRYGGGMTIGF